MSASPQPELTTSAASRTPFTQSSMWTGRRSLTSIGTWAPAGPDFSLSAATRTSLARSVPICFPLLFLNRVATCVRRMGPCGQRPRVEVDCPRWKRHTACSVLLFCRSIFAQLRDAQADGEPHCCRSCSSGSSRPARKAVWTTSSSGTSNFVLRPPTHSVPRVWGFRDRSQLTPCANLVSVFRTNGGPGCSSLEGLLQENGVSTNSTTGLEVLIRSRVRIAVPMELGSGASNSERVELDEPVEHSIP